MKLWMRSWRQVSPWPRQTFIGLLAVMPPSFYKFSLLVCEPTRSSPPTSVFSTTTCTSWGWKTPAGAALNTHTLIRMYFPCDFIRPLTVQLTHRVLTHKVWNCFSVFHVFRIATFLSHLESINGTAQKYKNHLIRQQQKFDETEKVNQQFIISRVSIHLESH